jgi:hypothetical protein
MKSISKAIVRRPGRNFAEGITTSNLGKPDFEKALEQHSAYCDALTGCGLELIVNPGLPASGKAISYRQKDYQKWLAPQGLSFQTRKKAIPPIAYP